MSDTNKAGLIPIRAVRVPDTRWEAGKEAAAANGETLSAAINRFIDDYVAQTAKKTRAGARTRA